MSYRDDPQPIHRIVPNAEDDLPSTSRECSVGSEPYHYLWIVFLHQFSFNRHWWKEEPEPN